MLWKHTGVAPDHPLGELWGVVKEGFLEELTLEMSHELSRSYADKEAGKNVPCTLPDMAKLGSERVQFFYARL